MRLRPPLRDQVRYRLWPIVVAGVALAGVGIWLGARLHDRTTSGEHAVYLKLTTTEEAGLAALDAIKVLWQPHDAILLLEALTFVEHRRVKEAAYAWLEETTGQSFGMNHQRWYEWIWNNVPHPPPRYASFKAALYARKDPELGEYFREDLPVSIRLDEVQWGGVRRDGIPPLRGPRTVPTDEATYLDSEDLVFGVAINGDARAYPRRILIHHELVTDVVGGEPITAPYCTLCNAMLVFRSSAGGRQHDLGTSGFVYRSNKLMYDRASRSLWYTFSGEPVVGPLVGQSLALEPVPVVTTTWDEWRQLHPQTRVLAEDPRPVRTGEPFDYREDVADRPYFQNDALIFTTPKKDQRMRGQKGD